MTGKDTKGNGSGLHIRLVGAFRVMWNGQEIRFNTRKSCAILAGLALSDNYEMTRERLVGLLWSEAESDRARASLRQALHELREGFHAAGFDGFLADKLRIAITAPVFSTDIGDIVIAATQGQAHSLIDGQSNIIDDLLAPLESIDAAFEAWTAGKRRYFEDLLTKRYEAALSDSKAQCDREALARALSAIDPSNEIATRHLMKARFDKGDVSGALGAYKALWDLLDEDYDTEPSRPTKELFAHIKLAEENQSANQPPPLLPTAAQSIKAPSSAAARPRIVISVAPFEVQAVPDTQHYLVHGFRRDLVSSLVRFREWLVRETSANGKTADGHFDEYTIEASAFAETKGIRLALMLRENDTGIYLWSERFKIDPGQWAHLQQSVVRRLANVLNVQISSGRMASTADAPSSNVSAYDLWLRAQAGTSSWDPARWQAALDEMKQLAHSHPGFAPAFSSAAQMLNSTQFVKIGKMRDAAQVQEAIAYATEATRIDPVDSRGHLALGWAYAMAGQHERAAVHHDLAADLNDNDPWTLMSSGLGAASRMQHDMAAERAERAMALTVSPAPQHWLYIAQIAFLCGDYERAVSVDAQAWTNINYAEGWRIGALSLLGRTAEATACFQAYAGRIRQAWSETGSPDDNQVAAWFLHLFPFSDRQEWAKLHKAMTDIGLDLSHAQFQSAF
ncbi:MAG: BTAD domain-containing putative transcriptional regulator [Beijerinckiaceae bacterium]